MTRPVPQGLGRADGGRAVVTVCDEPLACHQTYESLARKGETTTTAAMATYALGLAAPAQAATAVKTPVIVASAINIPTDFGHHAWVVDIQPHANVPQR